MKVIQLVDITPGQRVTETPTGIKPRRREGAGGRWYRKPQEPKSRKSRLSEPDQRLLNDLKRELHSFQFVERGPTVNEIRAMVRGYLQQASGVWVRTGELQAAFCDSNTRREELLSALESLHDAGLVACRRKAGGSYWMVSAS